MAVNLPTGGSRAIVEARRPEYLCILSSTVCSVIISTFSPGRQIILEIYGIFQSDETPVYFQD